MKRRFSSQDDGFGVVAEINVTSLVDVAFTLLIIFMITAPILQGGIDIDVPEAVSGPLSSSDALVVSIDEAGRIHIDDAEVTLEEFDAVIEAAVDRFDSDDVFLKADTDLSFGLVVRIMGRIQEVGGLVLVTDPETRERP